MIVAALNALSDTFPNASSDSVYAAFSAVHAAVPCVVTLGVSSVSPPVVVIVVARDRNDPNHRSASIRVRWNSVGTRFAPADAVALVFPMTRDPEILAKAWLRAAQQTVVLLAEGRDLVFLVEGDASTFATFGHLARVARELATAQGQTLEVETIPGVSSFAAAAATTGMPLAEEDETLAIIPAAYGTGVIDHMLDEFDTLILLKVKPLLDEVLELLERRDLLATSCFIEKVGSPDERIVRDLASLKGEKVNYLSLLLVQNPKRQRGELRRGCRQRKEAQEALSA